MKTCFYTPSAAQASWFDMVDLSARYGFDSLEIFADREFSEPDWEFAKKFKQYADEKGVKICCFSVFADLTGPDAERQIPRLKGFAEVAALVGSPLLHHTVCPNFQDSAYVEQHREELWAKSLAAVAEVYDYAKDCCHIHTAIEDQGFLLNGVGNFSAFLAQVGRNVRVVADFGNIRQADQEILPFLRAFAPRIAHVHLKESVLHNQRVPHSYPTKSGQWIEEVLPGTGTVPLKEGIDLLRHLGYRGICSLEWNSPDEALLAQGVDCIKNLLKE